MIDYFALALAHALLAIGFLRLAKSEVLDRDDLAPEESGVREDAASADAAERQA
ncbi:hypothetical protein [Altererythrobacter sp.]|uniref:hypothetical protein n=1 Tax=Altererythrobacter sp. TaxID=1872480 RepID=UPI003D0707B7